MIRLTRTIFRRQSKSDMARRYRERDLKKLWGRAAGRCSFKDCHEECIKDATEFDEEAVIGIIGHINSDKEDGPRYDPDYPKELLYTYENIMLLCPNHHALVDDQDSTYTAQELREWKKEHEARVKKSCESAMPSVSFTELEQVCDAIIFPPFQDVDTNSISYPITVTEKMKKNELTDEILHYLHIGSGKAKEVGKYVEHEAAMNSKFPVRLRAGFVKEYDRLWGKGIKGDDLFEALLEFANKGHYEYKRITAGIAVLVYLFEKCEVFES